MKWILFLFLSRGGAPVVSEHYMALMQEFDDKPACEAAIVKLKDVSRSTTVGGICLPKASEPAKAAP